MPDKNLQRRQRRVWLRVRKKLIAMRIDPRTHFYRYAKYWMWIYGTPHPEREEYRTWRSYYDTHLLGEEKQAERTAKMYKYYQDNREKINETSLKNAKERLKTMTQAEKRRHKRYQRQYKRKKTLHYYAYRRQYHRAYYRRQKIRTLIKRYGEDE